MSNNYGTSVSRVLSSKEKNLESIIFQQKRPPLDSEWNLLQDIQSDKFADIVRSAIPSGFLEMSDIRTAPENRQELNSSWKNAVVFNNPKAVVNGWLVNVGSGTNQFQINSQQNIWEQLSNNPSEVAIIGTEAPEMSSGNREDLVFLEVWKKTITPIDPIYHEGFTQSALANKENDLIDPNIALETTKRVQIQYRLRWIEGVDFITYRNGLGFPGCFAQGSLEEPHLGYFYTQSTTDPGLYISGNGDTQSQLDLNTVDGFCYAIPLARVHRRNKGSYSTSNLNGSSVSLVQGIISDRPNGLFYDEISGNDVEDLRHKVSFNGFQFKELLGENLDLLWKGSAKGPLKHSPEDSYVAGNRITAVQSLDTTKIALRKNIVNLSYTTRVFSEARQIQKYSFIVDSIKTDSNKTIWFIPIEKKDNPTEIKSWDIPLFYENYSYVSGPKELDFLSTNVNFLEGSIKIENHGFINNTKIVFKKKTGSGNTLPTGISEITTYYVIVLDKDTIKVSLSYNGVPIEISTKGTGSNSVSTTNVPKVWAYDEASRTYVRIQNGTWSGLGIESKWDYLTGNRNKISYTPDSSIDITTYKKLIFVFDLAIREAQLGFKNTLDRVLKIENGIEGNSSYQIIDHISSYEDEKSVPLINPSHVDNYYDSARLIAPHKYELGYDTFQDNLTYLGGCIILKHYKKSNGSSQETIPSTLYGRKVVSIHSIYNVTSSTYNDLPLITKQTDESFKINGIITASNNILEFTLFLGDTIVEYTPHTKGITNIVRSISVSTKSEIGKATYIINIKNQESNCDGLVSATSFYNGTSYVYTCFINNELKYLTSTVGTPALEGFGTSVIKVTLKAASQNSGSNITIPFVGYYNPTENDGYSVTYEYKPYFGILKDRLTNSTSRQRVKLRYVDDSVYVTTAGTGSSIQYINKDYLGLTNNLPLNNYCTDFNLFGDNIPVNNSSGVSSLRKMSNRDFNAYSGSASTTLKEGLELTLKLGDPLQNTDTLRGVIVDSPLITESGPSLSVPTNHLSQWSAIVEGLDELRNELFLMVITTVSLKYNSIEGSKYKYLELVDYLETYQTLYKEVTIGRGTESILNNNLTSTDLINIQGLKVIGAVDLFPLKGRPLIR